MKNFIEVSYREKPLLINIKAISDIIPYQEVKTIIYLLNTDNATVRRHVVKEDYNTVKAKIAEAQK